MQCFRWDTEIRSWQSIQGEHILSGSAASFVARARQEGRLPGGLEAWSSKDLSLAWAVPLICAASIHIMNLNYSIPGECKQLKNKGWESVYMEGSATEIFWIRQRWTSFYWRNIKFSSKSGFQTMWIGRAERCLCPGAVSVDCHASPKHFQGVTTLWFLSFHSLPESPQQSDCNTWGTVRRGKLLQGADTRPSLWGRVPALLVPSRDNVNTKH